MRARVDAITSVAPEDISFKYNYAEWKKAFVPLPSQLKKRKLASKPLKKHIDPVSPWSEDNGRFTGAKPKKMKNPILDVASAERIVNFVRITIVDQSHVARQTQANQSPEAVLALV